MKNYLNDYKTVLYRQIRFFLYYYNKPNAKKIDVFEWYYNLLDRYIFNLGFDSNVKVVENLSKYFYRIYKETNIDTSKDYNNPCNNAKEVVYILNKNIEI